MLIFIDYSNISKRLRGQFRSFFLKDTKLRRDVKAKRHGEERFALDNAASCFTTWLSVHATTTTTTTTTTMRQWLLLNVSQATNEIRDTQCWRRRQDAPLPRIEDVKRRKKIYQRNWEDAFIWSSVGARDLSKHFEIDFVRSKLK